MRFVLCDCVTLVAEHLSQSEVNRLAKVSRETRRALVNMTRHPVLSMRVARALTNDLCAHFRANGLVPVVEFHWETHTIIESVSGFRVRFGLVELGAPNRLIRIVDGDRLAAQVRVKMMEESNLELDLHVKRANNLLVPYTAIEMTFEPSSALSGVVEFKGEVGNLPDAYETGIMAALVSSGVI